MPPVSRGPGDATDYQASPQEALGEEPELSPGASARLFPGDQVRLRTLWRPARCWLRPHPHSTPVGTPHGALRGWVSRADPGRRRLGSGGGASHVPHPLPRALRWPGSHRPLWGTHVTHRSLRGSEGATLTPSQLPVPAPPGHPPSRGPHAEHECGETSGEMKMRNRSTTQNTGHQRPLRGPLQRHGTGLRAAILRFHTVSTETRPPRSQGRELAERHSPLSVPHCPAVVRFYAVTPQSSVRHAATQ